jgi:hypothetical protein
VTYDELRAHLEQEERDGALGLTEVIDARGATTNLTGDEVRALVARTDALVRRGRFGAVAIVTDNDFAFGMARMYQILCDRLPIRIGVFRQLDAALEWLGSGSGVTDD